MHPFSHLLEMVSCILMWVYRKLHIDASSGIRTSLVGKYMEPSYQEAIYESGKLIGGTSVSIQHNILAMDDHVRRMFLFTHI